MTVSRDTPRHLRLLGRDEDRPEGTPEEPALADRSGRLPVAAPVDLGTAFRAYGRYVAWIGMRILGRPEDVDDLVQDVFLDAVRGIDRLRDPNAAKAWLATLTVRKARRVLRKRRMRRFLGLDEGADYGDVVDESASSAERVMIADLYRLLDALPTEERLAWTLRHLENEPLERVATLCGCSLATVKRRIAAAHATLGGELGDD
jgi:RNA polymerase sigma-70 factor (ECF subfamily)